MNLPLKILLVERRQPDGCLQRALQGDFPLEFQWRRVSSDRELRTVAREFGASVVLSADDMQGRSQQAVAQMLCMLSPQRPQVMICELGDENAPWSCSATDCASNASSDMPLEPEAAAPGVAPPAARPELPHILQSSPDAVVMLDAEGWISEINDHARRVLGTAVRLKPALHVSDLIQGLQGTGEGDCTALPLVAVNLDGLLSLNAVHGMDYGNAVIDLIASVVQPQYARCGLLVRLGPNRYLAVLPHLSAPADAAVAVSGGRQIGADRDLTAVFGEATANDSLISATPTLNGLPDFNDLPTFSAASTFDAIPNLSLALSATEIDAILAADQSVPAPTAAQLCGRAVTAGAASQRNLDSELGDAIQRQALSVHFQPQYDLSSGQASGVEALARWTLASGRTLAPNLFIPIAERTGTIEALDTWILEQSCATAAAWRGRDAERLTVSVNVSNRQIGAALARKLTSVLQNSGLPARRLELEIEEGPIIANSPMVIEGLRQLKQLGVRIAVSHRSANYSSLAYLSGLAIDRLKLDKSLIHRMLQHRETAAMVRATIALGAALEVDVIAEGVESMEQLHMLKAMGCRHAQGYLLARPMPAVQALIALRKTWGNLPAGQAAARLPTQALSAAAY